MPPPAPHSSPGVSLFLPPVTGAGCRMQSRFSQHDVITVERDLLPSFVTPRKRSRPLARLLRGRSRSEGVQAVLLLFLLYRLLRRAPSPSDCAGTPATLEASLAAGARLRPTVAGLLDLVVVAGHAPFTGSDFTHPLEQDAWYLEPYQRVPGQVESLMEHMQRGVAAAALNPESLLLFSGGATRAAAGPLSEGGSYWSVSQAAGWFGLAGVRERAHTEEYARDTHENLLFSLCRFHELTGAWPRNVTVVGYEFKRRRVTQLHRAALRFPEHRLTYLGTEAPQPAAAEEAERAVTAAWAAQPFGCGAELLEKRIARDPFARGVPYLARCAALHGLLAHCGPGPYRGRLPWDREDVG